MGSYLQKEELFKVSEMLDNDKKFPQALKPRWKKPYRFPSRCRIQEKDPSNCRRVRIDVQPERTSFTKSWHWANALARLSVSGMHTARPSWSLRHSSVPVNCLPTFYICPEISHREVKFSSEGSYAPDDSPQNKFKGERGIRSQILSLRSQAREGKASVPWVLKWLTVKEVASYLRVSQVMLSSRNWPKAKIRIFCVLEGPQGLW